MLRHTKPFPRARDKQTPLNSAGDGAEGRVGGSGECISAGLCAAEMEKGNKAALLRAARAASAPPWRRQPGLAPALLPACKVSRQAGFFPWVRCV